MENVVVVQQQKSNGMATAGLVLAIVALPFTFIPLFGWVAWILTPLAIIFSSIGISKSAQNGGRGKAIAGLIIGILDIVAYWASWFMIGAAVAGTAAAAAAGA